MTKIDYKKALNQQLTAAKRDHRVTADESANLIDTARDAQKAGQGAAALEVLNTLDDTNYHVIPDAEIPSAVYEGREFLSAEARNDLKAFMAPPTKIPNAATNIAAQALEKAKQKGLPEIETHELSAAYNKIATDYSPAVADAAMKQALGSQVDALTIDSASWVQGKFGRMSGHIDQYQRALQGHLKDARLLDANFNGKLDEGDKIFSPGASGKVDVKNIDKALRDRVEIGAAVIGASYDMHRAGHDFGLINDHRFNEDYWQPTQKPGEFKLKENVKPSEALQDMFAAPEKYGFECATAMVVVRHKAMLDLLGPKDFDAVAPDLKLGLWTGSQAGRAITDFDPRSQGRKPITAELKESLVPGDYTYIRNWDVSPEGAAAGWQGENILHLGEGQYYGHPFGVTTADKIIDHLNTQRNEGSTTSASMSNIRTEMSSRLLNARTLR